MYTEKIALWTDSVLAKLNFADKTIPGTASPRIQKWCLFVASFDINFDYTKSVEIADFLIRRPLSVETGDSQITSEYVASLSNILLLREQIRSSRENDPISQ